MKCRRCKTNFDYETYYGICPRCAAYNRPDGKDEMKSVMGEGAKAFEEEYHPPVMSSSSAYDFAWQGASKPQKSRKQKKTYQERLSNPYVENTVKSGKTSSAAAREKQKEEKKDSKLWAKIVGIVLTVLIALGTSDFGEELFHDAYQWVRKISMGSPLGEDFGKTGGSYSAAFEAGGRKVAFGMPYEIVPEKGDYLSSGESLLVIPYKGEVTDSGLLGEYILECYLNGGGLYYDPVPQYIMDEAYGAGEQSGTLEELYGKEEKSMVFAGNFSGMDTVELTVAFKEAYDEKPKVLYRVTIAWSDTLNAPEAKWQKTELPEETLPEGMKAPVITKIGETYQGREAKEGYEFCRLTQEFENHGEESLEYYDMELSCQDADGETTVYSFEWENIDYDNPLLYCKLGKIPAGERGVRTSIIEVDKNCRRIKAVLYFHDTRKEWQASFE